MAGAETLVVKVGSRVLSNREGKLDLARVENLARQLSTCLASGKRVALVSSGAVACGMGKLQLDERPSDLARLQAVASVGQAHLIQAYEHYLSQRNHHAAQVLLTADDFDNRLRYLNVRNTLTTLLEMGVVPIINENDSVAVDELLNTFGDNDSLAAMVAGLFERPALIILSDVSGLCRSAPVGSPTEPNATQPSKPSDVVSVVETIDESIMQLVTDESQSSQLSKGGMASKLRAAQSATRGGAAVVIASGHINDIVTKLLEEEELGTLFLPQERALAPKKRWIGFSAQTSGHTHDRCRRGTRS